MQTVNIKPNKLNVGSTQCTTDSFLTDVSVLSDESSGKKSDGQSCGDKLGVNELKEKWKYKMMIGSVCVTVPHVNVSTLLIHMKHISLYPLILKKSDLSDRAASDPVVVYRRKRFLTI